MKVSVIIPVKKINGYILELYECLKKIDFTDFEVIIFPDKDSGIRLEDTRIIMTGPMGPAEKRDLALKHAKGEILAFLDDDAFPERDWLKNAVRHFEDEGVGAVGGPAVTPETDSLLQKGSGAVFSSMLTSSSYTYRYLPKARREVDDFPTVNLLVRKTVFEKLGGFDTAYWPGEDTKLCLDIKRLGLKIVYEPEAIVYHHRRPLFTEHLRQVSRYAFQRGFFVKAFPETSLKPGYFAPSVFFFFICSGPVLPVISLKAALAWAVIFSIYMVFLLAASIMAMLANKSVIVGALTVPGVFLTHIVYGYNFVKGLLSSRKGMIALDAQRV